MNKQPQMHDKRNIHKLKKVFAVIGVIYELKAQDIFIAAAKRILEVNSNCEFWIIGNEPEEEYTNQIKNAVKDIPEIRMFGEKSRDEMRELYRDIDIVVCSSKTETMSMTIVEGLMNEKIVLTTDSTGIAEYIVEGVNGFICKADNVESLTEKMQLIIDRYSEMDDVRIEARKTYEKFFTLKTLGENLLGLLT